MMETATSTSAPAITPANLTLDMEVDVDSRTWPGINKPGGHAKITKIHYDGNVATKVDVKYVLGGRELAVELTYVKAHVELERKGRSRRSVTLENVETFVEKKGGGGAQKKRSPNKNEKKKKKRKALGSLNDGNDSTAKATKKGRTEDDESSKKDKDVAVVATEEEIGEDGKWTLIKVHVMCHFSIAIQWQMFPMPHIPYELTKMTVY